MRNPVTWFEIMGKDSAALQRFYRDVFGWKLTPPVADMGNYSMLAEHGPDAKGAGGGIGEGDARVSVYVEVDDPQAYVDRASRAGASVLMPVTIASVRHELTSGCFHSVCAAKCASSTRRAGTVRSSPRAISTCLCARPATAYMTFWQPRTPDRRYHPRGSPRPAASAMRTPR